MLLALKEGGCLLPALLNALLPHCDFLIDPLRVTIGQTPRGIAVFYYHFMDPETGFCYRQVELSTIDTALLMAGVLFAGEYYQSSDPERQEICQLAERLYRRVDWQWMQQDQGLIGHGWKPESGTLKHGYGVYN